MKKKLFVIFSLFFIIFSYNFGKSKIKPYEIRIICPGEDICPSWSISNYFQHTYQIIFNVSGTLNVGWNLDLYREEDSKPVFVKRLRENFPCSPLTIGENELQKIYKSGKHFVIIRSTNNQFSGKSKNFYISVETPPPSVFPKKSVFIQLVSSAKYYMGQCPVTVKMTGKINASGPMTVNYHFVRSDGFVTRGTSLRFMSKGSKSIPFSYKTSKNGQAMVKFFVKTESGEVKTVSEEFEVKCEKSIRQN